MYSKQYQNEAYDYPPNIRESFGDLGRSISDKVGLLSKASSPAEAQAAFTAPPSAKPQPKTFNHAIARASLASSHLLTDNPSSGSQEPLAQALEKYALAEEKVGEARLAQDQQIQARFLAGWQTTLNTNIQFATKARRNVENSRLMLDSTKAAKKSQVQGRGFNPDDETALSEEARAEIEAKEDDFVSQVEEAQGVMKNVSVLPDDSKVSHADSTRFSTLRSRFATLRTSSLPSSNTTRRLTRFFRSSRLRSTSYRSIKRPATDKAGRVLKLGA